MERAKNSRGIEIDKGEIWTTKIRKNLGIYLRQILPDLSLGKEELNILRTFSPRECSFLSKYPLFMPRISARSMLDFARNEGIIDLMKGADKFSFRELCDGVRGELGYVVEDGVRRKMLHSLIGVFHEIGLLSSRGSGGEKVYMMQENIRDISMSKEEREFAVKHFETLKLFEFCMRHAPSILRGSEPRINYSGKYGCLMEKTLGSHELLISRFLCLKTMQIRNKENYNILDLCFGRGHGIKQILELYPRVQVWAIDFVEDHISAAQEKIAQAQRRGIELQPVKFISSERWTCGRKRGFGVPLPFDDEQFDAVFFALNDPYIPPEVRYDVYSDIYRVLKPGGVLGAIHFFYPDEGRKFYKDHWMRCQIYYSNFVLSAIAGFQGLYPAAPSIEMFKKIGFTCHGFPTKRFHLFNGVWWRMRKGTLTKGKTY